MIDSKFFIKESNVICAYQENKYICFEVFTKRNEFGSVFRIKLDPNAVPTRES